MNTNMKGSKVFVKYFCNIVPRTKVDSASQGLTHTCPGISLTSVIEMFESMLYCEVVFKNANDTFYEEISPKKG